jgi:glutaconate CoA-transferase subunit A
VNLVNADPVKGMQEYLDRFVYGPKSWTNFLDLIGIDAVLKAARDGKAIYDI